MKKIINGKKYNTETAKLVGVYSNGRPYSDFSYYEEELYKKKTGEFFLYGKGGAMTEYAVYMGSGWMGGEKITPLSYKKARKWAEIYLDCDEYEEIFGEVDELNDKLNDIAAKVDKVVRDFDSYDYTDNDYDLGRTRELVANDPYHIIEMLADMLEEVLI